MDEHEKQRLMKTDKFEVICLAKAYIDKVMDIQGNVTLEDFGEIMARVWENGKLCGQKDVLHRYSSFSEQELQLLDES